ncbi:MAG TPA: Ku protein [Candidatus Kapabacteria bacterium]|nr:Ku protein [Candidatus Kapabacteria bacterium]
MRAIWKGSISFGLVNIPIGLFPATRKEDVSFRQLRADDLSPIRYKRVADADGEEVPWEKIVKGYEYEKGQFVVVDDKDFEKAMPEATQSIDIIEFVDLAEIDPMFFDKPYYLEPQKGGKKAYALLRETLKETGKVGIARVVIKTRQHLAAVKPKEDALVLELMHFPDEVLEPAGLDLPRQEKLGKKEMDMAKSLVSTMEGEWNPAEFKDEYRDKLISLIEEKVKDGGKKAASTKVKPKAATNVVDLVAVLQKSLAETKKKSGHARETANHSHKRKLKKAA